MSENTTKTEAPKPGRLDERACHTVVRVGAEMVASTTIVESYNLPEGDQTMFMLRDTLTDMTEMHKRLWGDGVIPNDPKVGWTVQQAREYLRRVALFVLEKIDFAAVKGTKG